MIFEALGNCDDAKVRCLVSDFYLVVLLDLIVYFFCLVFVLPVLINEVLEMFCLMLWWGDGY